jgi:hypothetical protein
MNVEKVTATLDLALQATGRSCWIIWRSWKANPHQIAADLRLYRSHRQQHNRAQLAQGRRCIALLDRRYTDGDRSSGWRQAAFLRLNLGQ